jgi:hypothetical protein
LVQALNTSSVTSSVRSSVTKYNGSGVNIAVYVAATLLEKLAGFSKCFESDGTFFTNDLSVKKGMVFGFRTYIMVITVCIQTLCLRETVITNITIAISYYY